MTSTHLDLMKLRRKPVLPTKRTEEYTQRIMRQLGIPDKATVGRLALGRSLSDSTLPDELPDEDSETGKAIRGDTLFGDDLAVWTALVVEHYANFVRQDGTSPLAEGEDVSFELATELIRRHWDRGTNYLWSDWRDAGQSLSTFIQNLAQIAALPEQTLLSSSPENSNTTDNRSPAAVAVHLKLGEIARTLEGGSAVEWTLNRDGQSPHVGLFGKPGKGKTRTAKSMFRQIRAKGVPLLIIDPKGELREDATFVQEMGATVISLGKDPIPLNALSTKHNGEIRVADGFVEALSGAVSQLGPKQKDSARQVAKQLLAGNDALRFEDVVDGIDGYYKKQKLKTDSLTASLHKLRDYNLFEPTLAPEEFFARTWIISVNEASEEALRFALLFTLDALLRYLRAAPEAQVDRAQGVRALRLVLAIDEARRVMDVASPELLEGLVLECRSKGLACMFISQSPDHMDRASDDIVKQLEVVASFEADVSPRAMRRMFGAGSSPESLQQLPRGACLARVPDHDGAVVVRAWEERR